MIEYLLAFIVIGVLAIVWLISGLFNDRHRKLEEELDEWSGVYDVKREVDHRFIDPDESKRLRDKYNPK